MSTQRKLRMLAGVVALVAWAAPAGAQSTYGGVVGTVTDAQKAVIPGAGVKLTEVRTNV